MKRAGVRIFSCLAIVAIVVVAAVWLMLNDWVKDAVESAGPAILKVGLKADEARLSPFSGEGEVRGLVLDNPPGFKSQPLLRLERAVISVSLPSLLTKEIVIESLRLESPRVTFEAGLRSSNLSALLDNIAKTEAERGGGPVKGKKLRIQEMLITGGEARVAVSLLGGQGLSVKLPDIRLTGLGGEGGGLTETQFTKIIVGAIAKTSVGVITGSMHSAAGPVEMTGDQALEAVKELTGKTTDAGQGAAGALMKGLKGVGELIGK